VALFDGQILGFEKELLSMLILGNQVYVRVPVPPVPVGAPPTDTVSPSH